ncbi:MAG: rod shape-determining protein MreC [Microthrixaceae bacterium]
MVLTLLAVTLITLDARGVGVLSSARDGSRDAMSPVRDAARWVSTPFRNAWNGITGYDDLVRENAELRDQLDELDTNAMRESAAQEELALLKEQLGLSIPGDLDTQIARVTTGPYSNFADHTLELDKGTDHGLAVGNPVVTKGGLVGRIVDVSRTRSVVQLLTDPDLNVGVVVGPGQLQGVGHGSGDSTSFIVERVDLGSVVEPKDTFFAGGNTDSIMPPDGYVPIGTVDKVSPNEATRMQELQVNFSVDFDRLDVVQVIKWTPSS